MKRPVPGVDDVALQEIRLREYPATSPGIFLNAASWGLIPLSSASESADLTLRRNRSDGFVEVELGRIQHRCRSIVAELIGADVADIALSPNTSYGVNLCAALLSQGEPGAIVVSAGEFPANVLPYRALEASGFEVRIVPLGPDGLTDEEGLVRAIAGDGVVAASVSAVQFATGVKENLERLGHICRSNGVIFCVDAIQAVGASLFDVEACQADVVACGGQKWLCAPWGSGFTWIRPEVRGRLRPPMVSWLATARGADFDDMLHYDMTWRDNARKFELATLGIQDYLGLARSVEVLLEVGIGRIRDHIARLHEPVLDWIARRADVNLVTPADPVRRAGILSFRPGDPQSVARALQAGRVTFSMREGLVRFAPHFYNTEAEMEMVVGMLEDAA